MISAELAALAAHIRANTDQAVIAALAGRNDTELARLYNLDSPADVWRKTIPVDEYRDALVGSEIAALTAGAARVWEWVTGQMTLELNTGSEAVRNQLAAAWGAATATRAALIAIAKRKATVCESIYITGDGPTYDLGWEGTVTITEIGQALNNY